MDWEKCPMYGSLGRVEGMENWPYTHIQAWFELSEKCDKLLKTQDGPKRKEKLSLIGGRRAAIIKEAGNKNGSGNNEITGEGQASASY